MTTFSRDDAPICLDCVWFHGTEPPLRCDAYPDAIPADIANGEDPHAVLRGDEDVPVVFEEVIE